MTETLCIEGFDDALRILRTYPELVTPIFSDAMTRSLLLIEGIVSEYPPETAGNRPRAFNSIYANGKAVNRWYERNYGVRWVRKNGSIRGDKTSRMLGKSWQRKVTVKDGLVTGSIGNPSVYADLVQGEKQLRVHSRHGWVTLVDGVAEVEPDIYDEFYAGVDKLLQGFNES